MHYGSLVASIYTRITRVYLGAFFYLEKEET